MRNMNFDIDSLGFGIFLQVTFIIICLHFISIESVCIVQVVVSDSSKLLVHNENMYFKSKML